MGLTRRQPPSDPFGWASVDAVDERRRLPRLEAITRRHRRLHLALLASSVFGFLFVVLVPRVFISSRIVPAWLGVACVASLVLVVQMLSIRRLSLEQRRARVPPPLLRPDDEPTVNPLQIEGERTL